MKPESSKSHRLFSIKENWLYLFSQPSTNFRPVDGLRALSILSVVLLHALVLPGPFRSQEQLDVLVSSSPLWIINGMYGVDFFFVISGFLIANLLMGEYEKSATINLKRFYLRRFLRLMPAYYFALAATCLTAGFTNVDLHCDNVWTNFIYINNYISPREICMPWSWSLAIEEHFYFVFPLFLLFVFFRIKRYRLTLLLVLLLFSFLIRLYFAARQDFTFPVVLDILNVNDEWVAYLRGFYHPTHARFGAILCGVIAAHLYRLGSVAAFFGERRGASNLLVFFSLGLIVFGYSDPQHRDVNGWSDLANILFLAGKHHLLAVGVAGLLLGCLFPGGFLGRAVGKILSARFWYPLAQLSYSVYLFHPVVLVFYFLTLYDLGLFGMPLGLLMISGSIVSFVVVVPVYLFLERPFMNLRNFVGGSGKG